MQFVLHIWLLRNFYCGDAHHANYGKHSFNHHFQDGAHSVYQIYSVFKLFETAVCFAHFCFYEISTLVMRIMLTMPNIVLIITCNNAHTVYIRFIAFSNFSKLQFVLHILAFTKFLLRWWGPMANVVHIVQVIISDIGHTVYIRFTVFSIFSKLLFVLRILADSKYLLRWCAWC